MPIIRVETLPCSNEVKKEIITELSSKMSKITNEPLEAFTVVITEVPPENFGVTGMQLSELIKK